MAKVKKHRKHKPQPPPLSGLDKFLYFMLVILHLALIVAAAVLFVFLIPSAIAYADESIVAFNNSVGELCVLPICFFWLISGIALYELGTWLGQPLFGNKNYKSKNDNDEAIAWYKKCADTSYQKRGRTHSGADKDLRSWGLTTILPIVHQIILLLQVPKHLPLVIMLTSISKAENCAKPVR